MNQDYLWITDNTLAEMRLIVEGAIVLYEHDAMPLYEKSENTSEAKVAFNDIGKALYLMRDKVHALEMTYIEETNQV